MSLEAFISGHSVVTASGSFAAPDPDPSKNVNSPSGSVHLDWSNRASSNTSGYDSDDDHKNIVLAERTSQLMSSYRDYITSGRGEGDEEMNLERIYGEAATKERQHDRSSPQRRSNSSRGDMPPATVFNPRAMRHNAAPLLREWNMANPHLNPDADLEHEMDELWDDASGSSYDKKYRYAHPIYKTRQFKRALLGIVVVAAIVGMSVGIARASKREALPDWEGELQEALGEELEEKELLHETVGIDPPAKEMEEIPPEVVEQMPPPKPAYDKTEQVEGIAALDDDHMESVTRHVLCCSSSVDPSSSGNANSNNDAIPSAQLSRAERHHPTWYDRSSGWDGTSYSDALQFCSNLGEDTQLCPYEAYCPAGPHHVPLGGYRGAKDAGESRSSRSPIADHPNGWVQVGEVNACVQYTIMDPEDAVSDDVGKGKKEEEVAKEAVVKEEIKISDGEVGQADMEKEENDEDTQDEANEEKKEEDAGDAASAIVEHVTGNVKPGPSAVTEELLAKHQEAAKAEHELHHPSAAAATADATLEKPVEAQPAPEPEPVQARPQPDYQPAAQRPKPDYKPTGGSNVDLPAILHQKFKPLWLSSAEGWNGGSHADAVQFCSSIRGKKLCPYSAMCPEGPGGSVMGGRHALSFDIEGEQYAPVMGGENHWVFVGKGEGDARFSGNERRCMTHRQLEGRAPEWGLTGEKAEVKQHIMCCTVN